jgi:transketolase
VMTKEKKDLRSVMVQSFIDAVDNGVDLAIVVSDSTSTSKIQPFMEKFPERLINVGIAEQNLVGIATGLSLGGFVAVTANAAPFLVARANEQVKNDVCYSESNVKMIGLNAGVSYGPLASTHHAIDDISIMRGFGNTQIFAPCDPQETQQIIKYALGYNGPVYVRLDSAKFSELHKKDYRFDPGKIDVLLEGNDLTIFALGSVVHEAYQACLELKKEKIDIELINVSSIRPLSKDQIIKSIQKTKKAITVEEHSLHGGLGSIISEIIADNGLNSKLRRLGISEGTFSKSGPRAEIRSYYHIDTKGIMDMVKDII